MSEVNPNTAATQDPWSTSAAPAADSLVGRQHPGHRHRSLGRRSPTAHREAETAKAHRG